MGRIRLALAVAGVVALSLGPLAQRSGAATLDVKNLPNAMHASVENKAVILGIGGASLFVDPGPAYSLANIDYTRYADDVPADVAMKARGVVLDPGTIGGAVLWAPPNGTFGDASCNNQCMLLPTGVHEAAGFPGYSEAFYPDANGVNRQHTAKCLFTKDANEANPTGGALQNLCRNDAEATPSYAVADTFIDDLHSRGFTRVGGATGSTLISVGSSEALSDVRPTSTGKLVSLGYASASNILIANGVVQVGSIKASAEIDTEPGTGAPAVAKASCVVDGLQIAGVDLPIDAGSQIDPKQFKPIHDAALARGFDIQVIPPAKPLITTDSVGKHSASCSGVQIIVDDIRPDSPANTRFEFTLGAITVKSSSNRFSILDSLSDTVSNAVDDTTSTAGSVDSAGGFGGVASSGGSPSAFDTGALSATGIGSTSGTGSTGAKSGSSKPQVLGNQTARSLGGQKPISRTTVVALTTATASAIGGSIWLLIGVVMALASGTRLRLPGTRLR
jgi:hypothetical protein